MAIGVNDNAGLDVVCDLLSGQAAALRERVETWIVPGLDGVGAQKMGKGEADFVFTAVKFELLAAINTWYSQLQSQQGKICTVTDDTATATANVLIKRVSQLDRRPAITAAAPLQLRGEARIEAEKVN